MTNITNIVYRSFSDTSYACSLADDGTWICANFDVSGIFIGGIIIGAVIVGFVAAIFWINQ